MYILSDQYLLFGFEESVILHQLHLFKFPMLAHESMPVSKGTQPAAFPDFLAPYRVGRYRKL